MHHIKKCHCPKMYCPKFLLYLHVSEHYIETFWSIVGVNWEKSFDTAKNLDK